MDAAINEHRIVSTFVKEFVKQHVPDQPVPHTIIPDSYDNNHAPDAGDIDMTSTTTAPTIQIWGFRGSFTMPHYGHLRPLAIILIPIWWFKKKMLLILPTIAPTCFFMTNEHKARMWMCCATCGLCTIPISSRRCLSASKWCPRSWWSSSTIVSSRTSRNLSCNSLPCSPSHFTLRLCWFTWSLEDHRVVL